MTLKDNILKTAKRNFFSKGLRQVSMDEIAEQVGISKRTLYENYKSKEDLIEAVLCQSYDEGLSCMEDTMNKLEQQKANAAEILCRLYILGRTAREQINRVVFDELRKYYPQLTSGPFSALQERHDQLFRRLYADCKKDGFIREDIDTELVFLLLKDLREDKMGYVASGKYTCADIASHLSVPLIRSIGTPKGHRAFLKVMQSIDDPYIQHLKNLLSI